MPNRRNYSVTLSGSGQWKNHSFPNWTTVSSTSRHAHFAGSDYSRRKPIGRFIKPTTYSMEEEMYAHPNGEWKNSKGSFFNQESGVLPKHPSVQTLCTSTDGKYRTTRVFPSDLANRALINARLNLKNTNLDFGVAWGERRETARFVGDTLGLMGDVLASLWKLRKGKLDELRRLRRKLRRRYGNNYTEAMLKIPSWRLQWQYAVKPLMSDIYNACNALDDNANDRWKVTVKGMAQFKAKANGNIGETGDRDFCRANVTTVHSCFVRVDVTPSSNALRKATECGLTNPLALAWELTPLSFVVDWAIPLGDYFSSLDAGLGWDMLGFSSSNLSRVHYEFKGLSGMSSAGFESSSAWSARYYKVALSRSTSATFPLPHFPSVKDPFSASHVADGLAILTQAIAKMR